MSDVVGAPSGAKKAPQAGDVSGAVVPESDGVERWETFCDRSYYDLWCVRRVGERMFGQGFHVMSAIEAIALAELLNSRPTLPTQGSTAPASSPVPEVTGA